MVSLRHGSLEQLQVSTKLLLESALGQDPTGMPIMLYVVVDSVGIARGVIVNTMDNFSKVPEHAARIAFDQLKTREFTPASLRGEPITNGFPILFRPRKEYYCNEIVSCLESWPCYNDDQDYEKLFAFLRDNLHYNDTISITKIVYVSCIVDTLGNTHRHEVTRGVSPSIDQEAIRVCELVKFDKPAMQNGRPVSMEFTIPVRFEPNQASKLKQKHCLFKPRK